jgi:hypothetical protein
MRRASKICALIEKIRGKTVTSTDLVMLERSLNKIWSPYGTYFKITGKHFLERLHRKEHWDYPIVLQEIGPLLHSFSLKYAKELSLDVPVPRGVIREDSSDINIGFVVDPHSKNCADKDIELTMIIRKNHFLTKDPIFRV